MMTFMPLMTLSGKFAAGLAVLLLLLAVLTFRKMAAKYLSKNRRVNRAVIRSQLARWSPNGSFVARTPEDASPDRVHALIHDTDAAADSHTPIRSGIRALRRGLPTLPIEYRLPARVALEGVTILVLGSLAVLGVDALVALFTPRGSLSLTDTVVAAVTDAVGTLATGFPGGEFVFAFSIAFATSLGGIIYDLWWVVGTVLVLSAILLHEMARTLDDQDRLPDTSLVTLRTIMVGVVETVALVFVAGTVPTTVLGLVVDHGTASIVGALVAYPLAIYLVYRALFGGRSLLTVVQPVLEDRVSIPARDHPGVRGRISASLDEHGVDVTGYLVARAVTVTVAVAALPLLIAYAVAAASNGTPGAVASVIASGGPMLQGGILMLVVAVLGHLIRRGADGPIRAQAIAFAQKLTFGTIARLSVTPTALSLIVGGAFVLLAAFGVPSLVAAGVAVTGGVVYRVGYTVWQALNYQYAYRIKDDEPTPLARVVVAAGSIEDADGETLYVARVQDEMLVHPSDECLAIDAANYAGELLEDGTKRPVESRYHYEAVLRGTSDLETLMKELRQQVRNDFLRLARERGDREDVLDALRAEYPEHVIDDVRVELWEDSRIDLRAGQYRVFR